MKIRYTLITTIKVRRIFMSITNFSTKPIGKHKHLTKTDGEKIER